MSEPENFNSANRISHTTLNIILIMVETLLTVLLRFDGQLRQAVYPLAQANTVVCLRVYVPHVTFYATFTVNGILLDSELQPNQQVAVTINGLTWQVVQAMFSNQPKAVDALQFRGEADAVQQVQQFLQTIGVSQVVENIRTMIAGNQADKKAKADEKQKNQPSRQALQSSISDYQQQINTLTINQTQVQTQLAQLHSQNTLLKRALMVCVIGMLICLIGWIMA